MLTLAKAKAIVPKGLKRSFRNAQAKFLTLSAARKIDTKFRRVSAWWRTQELPVDLLLLGGESGIAADKYAEATRNILRPSTLARQSPHVKFLNEFARRGYKLFSDGVFQETAYYKNAVGCLELTGHYFEASSLRDIRLIAEKFIEREFFDNNGGQRTTEAYGSLGFPILVAPITDSDYFQIIEGNHRIAGAIFRGRGTVEAYVDSSSVSTPAQQLLLAVDWQKSRRELYQPVDLPEVRGWPLVRRCTDRFELIKDWLSTSGLSMRTYLDLGCSYGWFVRQFQDHSFQAHGVDMDAKVLRVGPEIYGISPAQLHCADISGFLDSASEKYDVVSMFSVLHHFVLGRSGQCTAEELIRKVDNITRHVLFIDTGEAHEEWFKNSLPDWTSDFVQNWIAANTKFNNIVKLGVDIDNVPPFHKNYRRSLFACRRS